MWVWFVSEGSVKDMFSKSKATKYSETCRSSMYQLVAILRWALGNFYPMLKVPFWILIFVQALKKISAEAIASASSTEGIHRFHFFDWDNTASHKPCWGRRHRAGGLGSKACLLAKSGWPVVQVHTIFTTNLKASSHPMRGFLCLQVLGETKLSKAPWRLVKKHHWNLVSRIHYLQPPKSYKPAKNWRLGKKVVATIALANCISVALLVHCWDGRRDAHETPKLCEIPASFE